MTSTPNRKPLIPMIILSESTIKIGIYLYSIIPLILLLLYGREMYTLSDNPHRAKRRKCHCFVGKDVRRLTYPIVVRHPGYGCLHPILYYIYPLLYLRRCCFKDRIIIDVLGWEKAVCARRCLHSDP